jgi:PBSX family phage terminase large subunit
MVVEVRQVLVLRGKLLSRALEHQGLRSVCLREVQKDLKDSAKLLLEDQIQRLGVGKLFDVQRDLIVTPGDGQIIFRGMQDYNAESIKSLEGFDRAWIEEAQTLSKRSLALLRPTMRKDGAEIWASWNPRKKTDAIDEFLRQSPPVRLDCGSGQLEPETRSFPPVWKLNGYTTRFIIPTSIRTSGRVNMSRYSRELITRRN